MSDGSYDPVTHTHPCARCGQPYECAAGFEQDGSRGWCRTFHLTAGGTECPTCNETDWCHYCGDAPVWADDVCVECSHDGATTVTVEHGFVVIRTEKDGVSWTLTLTRKHAEELRLQLKEAL